MTFIVQPPLVSVGAIKTFGPGGEQYEVGKPIRPLDDGDWLIEIKMIKTGEIGEYRWTNIVDDPIAQ